MQSSTHFTCLHPPLSQMSVHWCSRVYVASLYLICASSITVYNVSRSTTWLALPSPREKYNVWREKCELVEMRVSRPMLCVRVGSPVTRAKLFCLSILGVINFLASTPS